MHRTHYNFHCPPHGNLRIWLRLLLFATLAGPACAQVVNFWPVLVGEGEGDAHALGRDFERWSGGAIFVFDENVNRFQVRGFRPFHVRMTDPDSGDVRGHALYPFFNYRIEDDYISWDFFYFLNFRRRDPGEKTDVTEFNLFPFLFYRNSPDPEKAYFGVFPIAGNVKAKFGNARIDWFLFPFYGKFQDDGMTTLTTPWPFIKTVSGDGHHGFEFWPFYGTRHREGDYREKFIGWPFYMVRDEKLWLDQPEEMRAYLPFYFRHTTKLFENKSYPWPFVGRTTSVFPRYEEKRYFWPLFVQARGDNKTVNRWAPFYTHSIRKGVDKTWIMWPIYREQTWIERDLVMEKKQVLYIFYWNLTQERPGNVDGPRARKTHFWPFASYWNNGAGEAQFQFLSPLEPIFPFNHAIRSVYSPFFALYRFDKTDDDHIRINAGFNFFTYRRDETTTQTDLGPIVGWGKSENGSHFEVFKGFLSYDRKESGTTWRLFWIKLGGTPRTSPQS